MSHDTFLSFISGHNKKNCDRWRLIYYCKKNNNQVWYRSSKGLIRRKHKPTLVEPYNVRLGFSMEMNNIGISINIPDDMDIYCYSIKNTSKSMNEYGIDNVILSYKSCITINVDYKKLVNNLTTLLTSGHKNLEILSSLILEEIKIKNLSIYELDDNIEYNIHHTLSAFCTNYPSYRLCHICIGFIICLREYLGEELDDTYIITDDEYIRYI